MDPKDITGCRTQPISSKKNFRQFLSTWFIRLGQRVLLITTLNPKLDGVSLIDNRPCHHRRAPPICQDKKRFLTCDIWNNNDLLWGSFNPFLAREGQIWPTKPKTLNFGQKYNWFFKTALWQFLNLPKDSKNAKKNICFGLVWTNFWQGTEETDQQWIGLSNCILPELRP